MRYLDQTVGRGCRDEYWKILDRLRAERGYADYLGALQIYRAERPRDPNLPS